VTPLCFALRSLIYVVDGDNVTNCKQAPQLTNNAGKVVRFGNAVLYWLKNGVYFEGRKGSGIVRAYL